MYSDLILNQIQAKADLASIVNEYVHIQGSHKVLKGSCPFHQDNQNSFMVAPEKNIFKCFGCGKEGGPVEFLMGVSNISQQEAIGILVSRVSSLM